MAVGKGIASRYNRHVRIQRIVESDDYHSAGSEPRELVCEVSARITDALPSRGERIDDGINVAARPSRVGIRYRADVDASMVVLVGRHQQDADGNPTWITDRVAKIVSVPAEIGFRQELEFMIEDYSTAGNGS